MAQLHSKKRQLLQQPASLLLSCTDRDWSTWSGTRSLELPLAALAWHQTSASKNPTDHVCDSSSLISAVDTNNIILQSLDRFYTGLQGAPQCSSKSIRRFRVGLGSVSLTNTTRYAWSFSSDLFLSNYLVTNKLKRSCSDLGLDQQHNVCLQNNLFPNIRSLDLQTKTSKIWNESVLHIISHVQINRMTVAGMEVTDQRKWRCTRSKLTLIWNSFTDDIRI